MYQFLPFIIVRQIKTFYELILLCGNFTTILIFYENSTILILEPIVSATSSYTSIIINIDLAKNDINTTIPSHEHSMIISALESNDKGEVTSKIKKSLRLYRLNFYGFYLIATWNINVNALYERLMVFADLYKFDNVGLVSINPNGTFELSRITYDPSSVVSIPEFPDTNCNMYDKMFHLKTKDSKIDDLYAYILIDPPNVINLTSKDNDGIEVISMGGRDAYIASIIPRKLNISLKLCTVLHSYDFAKNTNEYRFVNEFMEKPYKEDNREPKQLNYTTFLQHVDLA